MKKLFSSIVVGVALVASALSAGAAVWSDGYGMGSLNDEYLIGGSGVNLAVVPSVVSNRSYFITSAANSGAPRITDVLLRSDLTGATLDFYIATNQWQIASNGALGTNIIWLTSTNSALNTNDVLIYRSVQSDGYQCVLISGNATDAGGLVYTNALGQNAIKLWNNVTNYPAAGDIIYKMRLLASIPVQSGFVTNALPASPWVDTLRLTTALHGKVASPALLSLTYSNAGTLVRVAGDYYVRQRR